MSNRRREELFWEFSKWGWDVKGWSQQTRKRYFQRARSADRWLTENRGVSILWAKPKDLQAYLFSTSPNARSRNHVRQSLLAFGEFLLDRGYAEVNHAASLPRLPQAPSLPKALSPLQANRIEVAAEILGGRAYVLVLLFLYGGLRHEEVQTLTWNAFQDKWIRFTGKGRKERVVPVHKKMEEPLAKWKLESGDPLWVFPSPRRVNKPISKSTIERDLKAVGEMAGLKTLYPHLLRHTCATQLLECGVDIRTIQVWLGHSSLTSTQIYTKVRPSRLEEAVEKLTYQPKKSKPKADEDAG